MIAEGWIVALTLNQSCSENEEFFSKDLELYAGSLDVQLAEELEKSCECRKYRKNFHFLDSD